MADRLAIESVGLSIARCLDLCFEQHQILDESTPKAVLLRTEDFSKELRNPDISTPMVSLFLYRVDVNRCLRPGWSSVAHQDGDVHLPLDLHFLLTPWGNNAEDEYRLLGHSMTCLERIPILSGPLLNPRGNWQPHEAIQLTIPEITTEDLMRTFDSLPADYKLSVPYLARVVRIDARDTDRDVPVHHLLTGIKPELDA